MTRWTIILSLTAVLASAIVHGQTVNELDSLHNNSAFVFTATVLENNCTDMTMLGSIHCNCKVKVIKWLKSSGQIKDTLRLNYDKALWDNNSKEKMEKHGWTEQGFQKIVIQLDKGEEYIFFLTNRTPVIGKSPYDFYISINETAKTKGVYLLRNCPTQIGGQLIKTGKFIIWDKRYGDDIYYPYEQAKIDTVFKRNKIYSVTSCDSTGKIIGQYFVRRQKRIAYYTDGKIRSIKKDPILRWKEMGHIYIYWEDNGKKHRYFERPRSWGKKGF